MAADGYLKIDAMKGESITKGYADGWMEIQSWSWGLSNQPNMSGGGQAAGKVSFQDLHFTKVVDSTTPPLMQACAQGQHIKKAELHLRKSGNAKEGLTYIKFLMEEGFITSWNTGGSEGSGIPMEQVSLAFKKFKFDYFPQKTDGTLGVAIKAGWDIAKNASQA